MSRIGKQPVVVPSGVDVKIQDVRVTVKGPKGQLEFLLPRGISVGQKDKVIEVALDKNPPKNGRALHGMVRARIANMVSGVQKEFEKHVEISGLGYRAKASGPQKLELTLGFSHPISFEAPQGVAIEVDKKQTKLVVRGIDKEVVGETAARIRNLKPPEPYKGAGIKFAGERVHRKAGKTAAGSGGAKK